MDNRDENLGAVLPTQDSDRHLVALREGAQALQTSADRAQAYLVASKALIAAVSENAALDLWNEGARHDFLRTLILQEDLNENPPTFHHLIASQHTSGSHGFIASISRVLTPIVRELFESRTASKNLVLLILLIRETLTDWITQNQISALHLEWFEKFTFEDLSLPYNCMFEQTSFRRNRDDVISLMSGSGDEVEILDRLPFSHILFLEWLSSRDWPSLSEPNRLTRLLLTKRASVSSVQISAAKSLAIRHWSAIQRSENNLGSDVLNFGDKFVQLADDISAIRSRLKSAGVPLPRGGVRSRLFGNRAWQGFQAAKSMVRAQFPFIANSKRRLKVAICVSGQLRGYLDAFPTWKTSLLRDVDHDLFVHSWFDIGRSGAEPFRYILPFAGANFANVYRSICHQVGLEEFNARYPTLFQTLAETGRVTEPELSEFYRTSFVKLEDDRNPPYAGFSNPQKMHSKIKSCFDMLVRAGRDYDLIVRIRPDKPIRFLAYDWTDLRNLCRHSPLLFADFRAGVHYANPMIGDQFAVGLPESMEIYSSTWELYPRLCENGLLNCPGPFHGHTSLAQVCWAYGIGVERAPIRFGPLLEYAPLASALIQECVGADAAGRMDRIDHSLLGAVASDLKDTGRAGLN